MVSKRESKGINNRSNFNGGGGIFVGSESNDLSITIPGSFSHLTFVNNYAQGGGGGLFLWNTADFDIFLFWVRCIPVPKI